MNFAFDTRIVLLICCLLQGLAGLRLIKVSIPAYKLRSESAFLECQYELNRPPGTTHTRNRHNQHGGVGAAGGGGDHGNDMNYIETDSAGDEIPVYRRMRTYSHQQQQKQHQQHQQQQKQQREKQQQQQHHYQAQRTNGGYYQQQYEQQQQQQQQQQQTQPSPYGHSVYRGSSTSLSAAFSGRVGASTYTGRGGGGGRDGVAAERDDSFGDSAERERHEEEEDNDANDDDDDEDADGGEDLYAIKWYKDNEEFYRYVPKANPPKTSYRVDGVRVIEEHSDSSRVLLRGLTLNSTGLYRCEVSAEAPNFSSVQGEGRMDIVYLPRDGPHIKGQQFQYQIGEILNLNCTSGKSHPASHLQWFINEQVVLDGRYLLHYNDTVHKHGLITSTLGLQLTVDARHFHNGAMRVKCLASISPVLWKGGKESVLQRRPGIIDNREAMLLVRSASARLYQSNFLSSLRLLTVTAILTRICQLQLHTELT